MPLKADTHEAIASMLLAHQLHVACRKDGVTVWTCRTCELEVSSDVSRHSPAQADHQAAVLAAEGIV